MGKPSKEQVHKNMKNIKGQDTSIELILRSALWKRGYRYRKNYKKLVGKPDIVLIKYKIAIFCDSEFWHGKDWDLLKARLDKGSNPQYWIKKITRNMERDDAVNKKLRMLGWSVVRFWGKDIVRNTDECVKIVEEIIFSNKIEEDFYDDN